MRYLLFISILLVSVQCVSDGKKKETEVEIEVTDVDFQEKEEGNWAMTGKIRNDNNFEIQGIVEVVLLDENDQMISQFSAPVNEGRPLSPGDSGIFSYHSDRNSFAGAKRYQLQFVLEE
jgi:hypothetical protein